MLFNIYFVHCSALKLILEELCCDAYMNMKIARDMSGVMWREKLRLPINVVMTLENFYRQCKAFFYLNV